MEVYSAVDPIWGWVGTFYMGVPILLLFIFLMVIGTCDAATLQKEKGAYRLYPLLKIIERRKDNGKSKRLMTVEWKKGRIVG